MAELRGRVPGVFDQAFLTGIEGVTELLLIRHAQQDLNFDRAVGEAIDPPLTEQGRVQARLLGEALSTKQLDAVFASPLKRALETAGAVQQHHRDVQIEVMEDLREVEVFRDIPPEKTARE